MGRTKNKGGTKNKMIYGALIFVIIILILEKFLNGSSNAVSDNQYKEKTNTFEKKEYLLTQTELKFYKLLKQITDKLDLNLFCQVAMYELVNCKDYKEFNKIRSKSIDFVITERNCKIKLCIELDDETHNNPKRIERDNLVNKIFKEANTKILRIKVQNFYNLEELEQKIKESL